MRGGKRAKGPNVSFRTFPQPIFRQDGKLAFLTTKRRSPTFFQFIFLVFVFVGHL